MSVRAVRFPLFDSLRALAALAVLGTHAAFYAGAYGSGSAVGQYAARLEVGVTVFFLISGFLLYRPFVAARASGESPPSTGPYAWRRFLRIVPGYWLALTVVAVWLGTEEVFTAGGVPTFYGLGQAYREGTIGGGIPQGWSLTIEVAFYVFLPFYAAVLRRVRGGLAVEVVGLACLALVAVAWKVAVLSGQGDGRVQVTPLLLALPAWLDQFALGMGLAVLSVWLAGRASLPRGLAWLERWPGLAWAGSALAFWAVSTRIGLRGSLFEDFGDGQYLERHGLFALVALGLLLPAVVGDPARGLVRRVLAHRALLWLGLVSYGIYLWHRAVLEQLDRWGFDPGGVAHPYLAWPLVTLGLTATIAAASYYALERPAVRLGRRLERRDEATDADQPGAASVPAAPAVVGPRARGPGG